MSALQAAAANEARAGGVVEAVLRETLELLRLFAREGAEGAIDLAGMPLTKDEREELEQRLGRGEVEAELDILGATHVWETAFSGVWWVRHWSGEKVAAEFIEVAAVPKILMSDRSDAQDAAARLDQALAEARGTDNAGVRHA